MKTFIYGVLALCAIKLCNAIPSCRNEIFRYTLEHLTCAQNGIEVQGLAEKIATQQMTHAELQDEISSLCQQSNLPTCFQEISQPIPGICNEAEKLQHFRNSLKVILTFNEYLCQNNGSKYLEFVKNDGADCYFNEDKAKCYGRAKLNAGVEQYNHYKDESICLVLEADSTCLHHYDSCENRNVKKFYSQILRSLKEQFSC